MMMALWILNGDGQRRYFQNETFISDMIFINAVEQWDRSYKGWRYGYPLFYEIATATITLLPGFQ
jgi:hypothetical protein